MSGRRSVGAVAFGAVLAVFIMAFVALTSSGQVPDVAALDKLFKDGNYKEAYDGFRKQCLDSNAEHDQVRHALHQAIQSLHGLARIKEADELLESTVQRHQKDWRVLVAVAGEYRRLHGHGFVIAGKYERGPHRRTLATSILRSARCCITTDKVLRLGSCSR
jgi:hypothetical protein